MLDAFPESRRQLSPLIGHTKHMLRARMQEMTLYAVAPTAGTYLFGFHIITGLIHKTHHSLLFFPNKRNAKTLLASGLAFL